MKRYDNKFKFLLTTKQKNNLKKKANYFNLSMAQYIRYLIQLDNCQQELNKIKYKEAIIKNNIDLINKTMECSSRNRI